MNTQQTQYQVEKDRENELTAAVVAALIEIDPSITVLQANPEEENSAHYWPLAYAGGIIAVGYRAYEKKVSASAAWRTLPGENGRMIHIEDVRPHKYPTLEAAASHTRTPEAIAKDLYRRVFEPFPEWLAPILERLEANNADAHTAAEIAADLMTLPACQNEYNRQPQPYTEHGQRVHEQTVHLSPLLECYGDIKVSAYSTEIRLRRLTPDQARAVLEALTPFVNR